MKWNISWPKKIVSVSISWLSHETFEITPTYLGNIRQSSFLFLRKDFNNSQVRESPGVCVRLCSPFAFSWLDGETKKKECNSVTLFGVIVIVFLWVCTFYRNLEQTSQRSVEVFDFFSWIEIIKFVEVFHQQYSPNVMQATQAMSTKTGH